MQFNLTEMGERIKKYRKLRKFTQEMLSEQVDISSQYLSEVENGKKMIHLEKLAGISLALSVTLDELVFGDKRESRHLGDFELLLKGTSDYESRVMFEIAASTKRILRNNMDRL